MKPAMKLIAVLAVLGLAACTNVPDATTPQVTLSQSTPVIAFPGWLYAWGTANDAVGLANVEWRDGAAVVTNQPTGAVTVYNYNFSRNFPSCTAGLYGNHPFTARAYDPSGNFMTSVTSNVMVYALTQFSEAEPNDTAAAANAMPCATDAYYASGSINPATDADFYAIPATAGQTLVFQTFMTADQSGPSGCSYADASDTYIRFYDTDGVTLLASNDDSDYYCSYLTYTVPATGTYYLSVRSYADSYVLPTYYLRIRKL